MVTAKQTDSYEDDLIDETIDYISGKYTYMGVTPTEITPAESDTALSGEVAPRLDRRTNTNDTNEKTITDEFMIPRTGADSHNGETINGIGIFDANAAGLMEFSSGNFAISKDDTYEYVFIITKTVGATINEV